MGIYNELSGTTIAFATSTTLTSALINLNLPDVTTKEVEVTTLADTVMKSVASAVLDQGTVEAELVFNPSVNYRGAVGLADELITVTLPKLNVASVNGARYQFSGHITKIGSPNAANGTRATIKVTIKVNTKPTFTDEA